MSPYIASLFSPITLGATFRLAAPLLFGIAGFSFSNKAGILNLALESYITFAAFFALLGSWLIDIRIGGCCSAFWRELYFHFCTAALSLSFGRTDSSRA